MSILKPCIKKVIQLADFIGKLCVDLLKKNCAIYIGIYYICLVKRKSNNGRTSHLIFPQSRINCVIFEHPCKVIDLHIISNCFVNYCI